MNAVTSDRYANALAYAATIHAGQVRKGTTIPYVSHLLSVSARVWTHGGDEDQAIAGLLHDAIEDVGAEQRPIIEQKFGARVVHIVNGCTDADVTPKPPWRQRKEAYLQHLAQANADTLLVSACDKLDNAEAIVRDLQDPAIGATVFDRFNASRKQTLWYYTSLRDCFKGRMPARLHGELVRAVKTMGS